ncbi:DUF1178 family protein [Rhodoferax sp.]|uniref:DUF1178 family protein n=1 Tax=Rhodoferax sp. TaxID=50421 RepID=UPI0025D8B648|nr:DUF1178 family protein [Rhodoferax sp.]
MKVLDLQCAHQHTFEGWFGSEDDFQSQLVRGLVECPLCGNSQIVKKLSAPRLNLGAVQVSAKTDGALVAEPNSAIAAPAPSPEAQAAWMKMVRHVIANTEDVGSQFAEEARKIHYGERKERNIRGEATAEETEALLDEGIDVLPLPIPAALKRPLQ